MVWEFVFLMLIMKIPIVYLCSVVYWAVKAEPRPPEPAALVRAVADGPEPRSPWSRAGQRPRRPRPHTSPSRGRVRVAARATR